jgi:hypothetical protein
MHRVQPDSGASSTFDVFEYDADHAYSVHDRVAIYMWRGTMQPHHPDQARERWRRLKNTKGHFGVLVVILPSAPPPPLQLRTAVTQAYLPFAQSIRGVGTVLEDQGIRGAAGAMAMTAIMMMSKPPYAYHNGTSVEATARWLARQLQGGDPSAQAISLAAQHMRARYSAECENEYKEPLWKPDHSISSRA